MKRGPETILFWVAMIFIAVLLWKTSNNSPNPATPVSNIAELQKQIADKNIKSPRLTVYPSRTLVIADKRDSTHFQIYISNDDAPKIIEELEEGGLNVSLQGDTKSQNSWQSFLLDGVPFILLLGAFLLLMRQMQRKNRSESGKPRPIDV